jgi:hypothetical protein
VKLSLNFIDTTISNTPKWTAEVVELLLSTIQPPHIIG